jgi:hypothetical protein
MDKFSIIRENHNLGKFSISKVELNKYRQEVDKIIHSMYADDMIIENGFGSFVKPQSFEPTPNRHISILNKANTNLKYLSYLVDNFELNSINEVINFINDRKDDLFSKNGKYLSHLVSLIRSTEQAGERNEELASRYIKSIILEKTNTIVNPIISPVSSKKDLVDGIDIEFQIGSSRKYTCQVKPFKSRRDSGDFVIITSSGLIKEYKVDYLSFSDYRTNKVFLFRNRDFKILGNGEIEFPKSSEVM